MDGVLESSKVGNEDDFAEGSLDGFEDWKIVGIAL